MRGQRNAEMEQMSSLRGPNVTESNIGVLRAMSNGTAAATDAAVPEISAPSLSFNRRDPTDYLVAVSASERLLCTSVSQQNSVRCSAQSDYVNRINSLNHPVSSSHSLPGFSQSSQPELRNVPLYAQSHMPRRETNPTSSYVPLPTANFSSGPYMSSTEYYPVPGYFPQYTAPLSAIPFTHATQESYSMLPTMPQPYGPSYHSVASPNVAQPCPPAPGRLEFSVPGQVSYFSVFERSSLTRKKRTAELFGKWHISFKGDRKRDPEGFLANLTHCKKTYELNLDEIIKALP